MSGATTASSHFGKCQWLASTSSTSQISSAIDEICLRFAPSSDSVRRSSLVMSAVFALFVLSSNRPRTTFLSPRPHTGSNVSRRVSVAVVAGQSPPIRINQQWQAFQLHHKHSQNGTRRRLIRPRQKRYTRTRLDNVPVVG